MKYIVVTVLCCCSFFGDSANAQQIIKEGSLVYATEQKLEHPLISNEESESRKKKRKQSIFFSEQLLRLVDSTNASAQVKIMNCNSNENYTYASNGSNFYQLQHKGNDFFDFRAMGLIPPTIQYVEGEKIINGFNCKKAMFSVNLSAADQFNMEVWYCPDYSIESNCFNYYFKELKGIPVMFTFKNTKGPSFQGGTVISTTDYLLTAFSTAKMDKSLAAIADKEKYYLVPQEEIMKIVMEISKW